MIRIGINENTAKKAEIKTANEIIVRETKKLRIAKRIFIPMSHIRPSMLQEKMRPGNLIDLVATDTNTSLI